MQLRENTILAGRYRLLSRIGDGGMGTVWRALDERLGREVAIKTVHFPPGLTTAERQELHERMLREARSAARLSHPGIVTVHDAFEEAGRPCIVMEFLQARPLHDIIRTDGRMSPARAAEIGVTMLSALRVAHAAGILHRDVKPPNVLLSLTGSGGAATASRVVITDFGIAAIEGEQALTRTGMVLGSPPFIAPERVAGEWASPASDLWSLGATLYTAVEGRPPYPHGGVMETLQAVLDDEPEPPRHAGPLTPVLKGLLTKDVALRMSAEQAAEGLAQVLRQAAPPPSSPPATAVPGDLPEAAPETGRTPWTRRTWKTPALAVSTVLAVVWAGFVVLHPPGGKARVRAGAPSTVAAGPRPANGPGGTALAVPDGWRREAPTSVSVRWSEPDTGAYLQVSTAGWGVPDPVEHWRRFQRSASPAVRVLRWSRPFLARGWTTADIEFTSARGSHRRRHGHGRAFTASGHQYTILVVAPAARWSGRYITLLDRAFQTLQPARL
ncbi:serine/threonine-protein kinase [Actinomadura sp. DC4]|uniref:serine/threonine-protein kinase n=1 Tax=Actinomadura sp. DC4 TaxID=3055069 RepID=UPI0025B27C32|nr:serine/threonine-protein kinase [Actinomadura sp. DC4]MDN3355773.1 serine/threonine-protein kinase [Actinomadura sp. DC4]